MLSKALTAAFLKVWGLLALLTVAHHADAALLTEWGTYAQTSTRLNISTVLFGDRIGGRQESSATSSINNNFGSGDAMALLDIGGSLSVPQLQARAAGGLNAQHAQVLATGIEGYTNTGPDRTINLNVALSINKVVAPALLRAQAYVFDEAGFFYQQISVESLLSEALLTPLDFTEWEFDQVQPPTELFQTLSFDMASGQSIYLWTHIFAQGDAGGEADAFGTLTFSFKDSTGLVAASQPSLSNVVPEPSAYITWGLLGLCIGGVAWWRRRV